MTKRNIGALVVLAAYLALAAPYAPVTAADPASEVDAIFAPWSSADSPGCAVAVAQAGETVLARGYGMADLEHDVPNTAATVFEAGSVSKQFTAAAIVLLAAQRKLSLDDDVRRHVPEVPDYGTKITLRHLLSHTSGLRDWGTVLEAAGWPRGTRIHTHDHVLDIVSRQQAINFAPGSEYLYCNTGYNLLAIIVERVSGRSLADFTRQSIFEPLGMAHTGWRDDFTRIVKGRAVAYTRSPAGFRSQMPFENVHGNGGLLTTVEDLLVWNENFAHPRVGGVAMVEELQRRAHLTSGREISYAAGLVVGSYRGVPEVSHSGSTAGYRAFLSRYPQQRLSVALLCNVAQANPTTLARRVAEVYFAPAARVARAADNIDMSPEALASKAGLYRNGRTNEPMRLVVSGGTLRTDSGAVLVPLSPSRFRFESGTRQLEFGAADQGAGAAARLTTDEGEVIEFERVVEVTPTAAQLAEYEGDYYSDEAETAYTAVIANGQLALRQRPQRILPLAPSYADAFTTPNGWLVRFVRNPDGRVSGLSLGLGRVRDLRFSRVTK